MEEVIKIKGHEFSSEDYQHAKIVCEELIPNARRIDILIRVRDRIFPIEVKIYAADQDKQCQDYYKYAVKSDSQTKIYYLTIEGHEPSNESKGDLLDCQYECLSFEKDILGWLDNCIRMPELEQIYSVREVLIQFRDVIRKLARVQRGKCEMEIKEVIEKSYENMVAAMEIVHMLPDIKADKMRMVFDAIKAYMESYEYEECIEAYCKESEEFYKKDKKTWPSINYVIPVREECLKRKLILRFEIEERLYFGVCAWSGTDNYSIRKELGADVYVKDYLTPKNMNVECNHIWYWWQYLNKNNNANFRRCGSEYLELFDSDKFDEYMKTVYSVIDEAVKDIIPPKI